MYDPTDAPPTSPWAPERAEGPSQREPASPPPQGASPPQGDAPREGASSQTSRTAPSRETAPSGGRDRPSGGSGVGRSAGPLERFPTFVTLTLVLLGVAGLANLLSGIGYIAADAETIGITLVVVAAALSAAAWGIYVRATWAWWLAAFAAGIAALVDVVGLYTGDIPTFLFGLVIAAVILALLFTMQVRDWTGVEFPEREDVTGRPT